MIVTEGGRFGGFGLYILKGKPIFVYNLLDLERFRWEGGAGARDWMGDSLKKGKHTIEFNFHYDGPGIAKGGTGILIVDGHELATKKLEHTIPFLLPPDETFDVLLSGDGGANEGRALVAGRRPAWCRGLGAGLDGAPEPLATLRRRSSRT